MCMNLGKIIACDNPFIDILLLDVETSRKIVRRT